MDRDLEGFFLQDDPLLNQREAWPAQEFPQANYHYFRDSGCVMTSLWNMCLHYRLPGLQEDFPSPWELNEACKAKGAFYQNANLEMALLREAVPVDYLDRFAFQEEALREQLDQGIMCLLRVNGKNGFYHYVLPLQAQQGDCLQCFDPKDGYTELNCYKKIYQVIRFQQLW